MKDTGGPAFPAQHFDLAENEHGMTLRDYFAAKAMQVFLNEIGWNCDKKWIDEIVVGAYRAADAMLVERYKQ